MGSGGGVEGQVKSSLNREKQLSITSLSHNTNELRATDNRS